jgi:phosphocarrier protein
MPRSARTRGGTPTRAARSVTVVNERGLHARAAAKFVQLAERFDAEVKVNKGEIVVSGTSIMGLMMLAASAGCRLELSAEGPDAEKALGALARLIGDKFDED